MNHCPECDRLTQRGESTAMCSQHGIPERRTANAPRGPREVREMREPREPRDAIPTVSRDDRPWWQVTDVTQVRERLKELPLSEVRAVAQEMRGAVDALQVQIDTTNRTEDPMWWKRARGALGFTKEKHAIALAEVTRRRVSDAEHAVFVIKPQVSKALRLLEAKDVDAATDLIESIKKRLADIGEDAVSDGG